MRPWRNREPFIAAALFACSVAPACSGPKTDITKSAREALVTLGTEGDATGLTTALFATTGRKVVVAGEGAKLSFLPRGCLSATHDEAARRVTYQFRNCTYLRSIRVSGDLSMAYAEVPDGYDVTMNAAQLQLGAATGSLKGSAKVRADGAGVIRVTLDTQLVGESKAGAFDRAVKRTITWSLGTACFDAEGVSQGDISGRSVSVTVGPYRRCRSQCPEAKSEVVVRDDGRTYRVTFDGSDTASLVEDGEATRILSLACER